MLYLTFDNKLARQRVDELNQEALNGYLRHCDDAQWAAREAARIAHEIDYTIGYADALQNLARCARMKADFRKSAELSQKAFDNYKRADHVAGMADTLTNLAFMQINLESYHKALPMAKQAMQLARQCSLPHVQSFSSLVMGMICEHLDDYVQALHHHRQALNFSLLAGDFMGEAAALLNMGIVLRRMGNFTEALNLFNRAAVIFARHDILLLTASTKYYQATVYDDLKQPDTAWELLQEALAIIKKIDHAQGQGPIYLRLGAVRLKQQRFAEAEEYLLQSIELSRSYCKRLAECKGMLELARCYHFMGNTANAIALLLEAEASAELYGHPTMRIKLLQQLAQLYAQKSQWRQAFMMLQQASSVQQQVLKERWQWLGQLA